MAQKRDKTSIWKRKAATDAAAKVVAISEARAERTYPPAPLDIDDGNPRLVIVKYLEPNPLFPDDESKGVWRVAWSLFGNTDTAGAIGLVADAMPSLYSQGIGDVLESLRAAGERVRAAEERAELLARGLAAKETGEPIAVLE